MQRVHDGNDLKAVDAALGAARAQKGKPALILCRTVIGYGSPNKAGTSSAHGSPLGEEEVKLSKQNLGWPLEPTFFIPEEALQHFREALPKGEQAQEDWRKRLDVYRQAHPELAREWDRYVRRELPEGWQTKLPVFSPQDKPMATRQASGIVLNAIGPSLPLLVGGSADLSTSTETTIKGLGTFGRDNYGTRNLYFGVREHAMGAAINGMTLTGLIGYGGTFLTFSDYARPALRLASLMEIRPIWVFTHDSIFMGEDGPTHQPIEHLLALRAIPHLCLIRPADANETVIAWRTAVEHHGGPVLLVLTRQVLPILDRMAYGSAEGVAKGAYILAREKKGPPQAILIASGSEVSLALEAHQKLATEAIDTRVVSMPSWFLFDRQPQSYRDEVLPPDITARLAIEAASPLGWERYVGTKGAVMGMNRFGASAPYKVLAEQFGFTAAHVVEHVRRLLSL